MVSSLSPSFSKPSWPLGAAGATEGMEKTWAGLVSCGGGGATASSPMCLGTLRTFGLRFPGAECGDIPEPDEEPPEWYELSPTERRLRGSMMGRPILLAGSWAAAKAPSLLAFSSICLELWGGRGLLDTRRSAS